jgi:hypothetical protein
MFCRWLEISVHITWCRIHMCDAFNWSVFARRYANTLSTYVRYVDTFYYKPAIQFGIQTVNLCVRIGSVSSIGLLFMAFQLRDPI